MIFDIIELFSVFSCNFMAIIGIIANIYFLLMPWLILYGVGKLIDFSILFFAFSMTGCFCMICLTFNSILISQRKILDNILILIIFVVVVWMWFMVNQVRQDIRDKRNMIRQEEQVDMELIATDDNSVERTDIWMEPFEDPIEI